MMFHEQYKSYGALFEEYAEAYFLSLKDNISSQSKSDFDFLKSFSGFKDYQYENSKEHIEATQRQLDSMAYSFFNGGKRFRPVLCLGFAHALSIDLKTVLPWALAIEMVHTYSLIHDDLPCMDNDDYRRGKLTNHKVYGESTALLSGDALLTMAFEVLSLEYRHSKSLPQLMTLLSQKAGLLGMIGGQSTDLRVSGQQSSLETLLLTHKNKTSALLEACVLGVGALGVQEIKAESLQKFGVLVGLCFQLSDDLMDFAEKKEVNNFVHYLGEDRVRVLLQELSGLAIEIIQGLSVNSKFLQDLVLFNRDRKI